MKLLEASDARKIVVESRQRKEALIGKMNNDIQSNARNGLNWVSLVQTINMQEREWLIDSLVLNGFRIDGDNVTW